MNANENPPAEILSAPAVPPAPASPPADAPGTGNPAGGNIAPSAIAATIGSALESGKPVPKRGPGRPPTHGKYAKRGAGGKFLPAGGGEYRPGIVGAAPMEAPSLSMDVPGAGTDLDAAGTDPGQNDYDRATALLIIDSALDGLNEAAAVLMEHFGQKFTGDNSVDKRCSDAARMKPEIRERIRQGAVLCAEKYQIAVKYGPELALTIPLGLWATGQLAVYRTLRLSFESRQNAGSVNAPSPRP